MASLLVDNRRWLVWKGKKKYKCLISALDGCVILQLAAHRGVWQRVNQKMPARSCQSAADSRNTPNCCSDTVSTNKIDVCSFFKTCAVAGESFKDRNTAGWPVSEHPGFSWCLSYRWHQSASFWPTELVALEPVWKKSFSLEVQLSKSVRESVASIV